MLLLLIIIKDVDHMTSEYVLIEPVWGSQKNISEFPSESRTATNDFWTKM